MISWWRDTVTRLRPGEKTERGQTVPDWDNAEVIEVAPCSVQPASTSLSQDGRILGISDGLTAYLPYGSDVKAGDRIAFDGEMYTINGVPEKYRSATGQIDYIKLNLIRWAG